MAFQSREFSFCLFFIYAFKKNPKVIKKQNEARGHMPRPKKGIIENSQ
jgi:hypothetical protein